jgi:hypothetical protein
MMKLSHEKYNFYRKTLDEFAFLANGNFSELGDALKAFILAFVDNHPNARKHLIESNIYQEFKKSCEWFRALNNSEYPLEPLYSKKRIKTEKFLDDQKNIFRKS